MKVLLVITNFNGFHEIPYSFGLYSLAAYIESKGYKNKIVSINNQNDLHKFVEVLKDMNPEVVGFSSVSSQYSHIKRIAGVVKSFNSNIITICGGVHITLHPESLLETQDIDYGFVGESEVAFNDFLNAMKHNRDYLKVNNLAFRKDDDIHINSLYPLIQELDTLPFPLKDDLFEETVLKNGYASFFFSRGCPYNCKYCSNQSLGRVYGLKRNFTRYRSAESCIEEIKAASTKFSFNKIYIMDDTFGINKRWRKEFCDLYKKSIGKPFICLLRVNIVDEDFISMLKSAGCYRIQFGIESGNNFIRNNIMKRNISEEQIISAFQLCRKNGIQTTALNIIGTPGETEDMILDTIKLNRKIKPTASGVNIFYPYKGTPLGDECFDKGIVDEKMYNTFTNERRETVLLFPDEYKTKLKYYHSNWERLIFPYNIRKQAIHLLNKKPKLYELLRNIYRRIPLNH